MRMILKTKAMLILTSLSLLAVACGGQTPEAETPADETADEKGDPKTDKAASSEEGESESEAREDKAPEPQKASPKDVLLKDGTAFMIDHAASDMGKAAEAKCEKQAGDDVAKKANCLSKAINNMEREGFTFVDDGGEWWYVRFAVIKNKKQEYNRIRIDEGTVSGQKVTFKTTGADKGSKRKGKAPAEITFVVEDEYSIIMEDDKRGKLVLEPKMGLFQE